MATAGSSSDPLGSGEPSGSNYANNLTLLGEFQNQNQFLNPLAQQNVTSATTNLGAAAKYDLGTLSGNREEVLATQAPEISSLLSSYDAARKSAAQLTPRGGGRSEILNELPYKEAGDVNKLIQQARPEAAKNLTQVAGAQGLIGTELTSQFSQNVQSSLDFLLGKAGVQLDSALLQGQQGQQMGQAIGQSAAQLIALAAAA